MSSAARHAWSSASLSSAAVAHAAALSLAGLLPPPVVVHRSVVIVAAGGRDLVWPQERIASALLQRSGGRPVHLLLHGGARGADRAIGRAAQQLGWRVQSLAADWRRHGRAAGPIRNRLLLEQALVEAQAHTSPTFSASVLVIRLSRWGRHGLAGAAGPALLLPFTGAGGGDGSAAAAVLAGAPRRPRSSRSPPLHVPMAVLTAPVAPLAPALPQAAGPSCSLQRSGSLWQLGIEAQELTTSIAQLAQQLEADDDDSRAQALAELEAALLAEAHNKTALAAKADATCWVIEHLRGQAAYRQQQAKRLTELSRSDASRADALEDSLVLVLTRLQPTANRFSFPNHELTSRKSQAVENDDEDALDPQWLSFTTTSKPDKAAIKEALKAGREITGVQLISRRSWRIC